MNCTSKYMSYFYLSYFYQDRYILFHSGSVEPSYHPVLLVLCHCICITQDELKLSMP